MGTLTQVAPHSQQIGTHAARGFFWAMLQSIGGKLVGFAGQIMLAWFLLPEDFGLIGLTFTVTVVCGLVQNAGTRETLVNRQRASHLWVGPIFWFALARGFVAMLLMLAMAPLASRFYGEPRLIGLIAVMAVGAPISAVSAVPQALMQSQMRFRPLAALGTLQNALAMGLSVLLAWKGFGAYSFVVPNLLLSLAFLAWYWRLSQLQVSSRLQIKRWRFLLADTGLVFVSMAVYTGVAFGDYVILGRIADRATVGLYFFSYNLSGQTMLLLAGSLSGVLLPSLSKITSPEQQTTATIRAARMLTFVAIPLCTLQSFVAPPLLHMVFGDKWEGATIYLVLLSLAMSFRVTYGAASSLLIAQRRFALQLRLLVVFTAVFLLACLLGGKWAGATGVAAGELVAFAVCDPMFFGYAVASHSRPLSAIVLVYGWPCLFSAITAAAALLFLRLSGCSLIGMYYVLIPTAVIIPGYVALYWLVDRELVHDIVSRMKRVVFRSR